MRVSLVINSIGFLRSPHVWHDRKVAHSLIFFSCITQVDGFAYSAANKNSGITWSAKHLEVYLQDPKKVCVHSY